MKSGLVNWVTTFEINGNKCGNKWGHIPFS